MNRLINSEYNLFDIDLKYISKCEYALDKSKNEIFSIFDSLNVEEYHYQSRDDTCTPMTCVEQMIEAIPKEFWSKT